MNHFDKINEERKRKAQYDLLLRTAIKAEIVDEQLQAQYGAGAGGEASALAGLPVADGSANGIGRTWQGYSGYITDTMAFAAALDPDDFTYLHAEYSYLCFYRGMGVEAFASQVKGNALDPAKGRRLSTSIGFRPGNVVPRFEHINSSFVLGMANAIVWQGHSKLICVSLTTEEFLAQRNRTFVEAAQELPILILLTGTKHTTFIEALGYKCYDLDLPKFADRLKRARMLSERVRNHKKAIVVHSESLLREEPLSKELQITLLKMKEQEFQELHAQIAYEVQAGLEQATMIPGPTANSVFEDIHHSFSRKPAAALTLPELEPLPQQVRKQELAEEATTEAIATVSPLSAPASSEQTQISTTNQPTE